MTLDSQLIILSWEKDLLWLDYCLRSVKKYWHSSHPPLLIVTPECESRMPAIAEGCRIIYEPQWDDHHQGQVYAKMNADQYTDASMIMFVDSDCLFMKPCSTESFCHEGRPIVIMEHYSSLISRHLPSDVDCFVHYKEITGIILHILPEYEYMRRPPFLFYRDHIRDVRERIESIMNMSLLEVSNLYYSRHFSEFNFFGAYCRHFHPDLYLWQDVWSAPDQLVRHFHSWSQNPVEGAAGSEVAKILA